ncbi:MAG: phosphoribosylformylglycinamidine synthase subunit PurL [Alphaproteobacteria bacterium]|nr:MAG: phosphoribosylformylglycinamidine synthase subunit PurL [Alphaproteobacteria bacterium]
MTKENINSECTLNQAMEMGLTEEEFKLICQKIGKTPNLTETGICSAMFSEHCSYKSSKKWLKTLPTSGDHVIQGPGENAGIIDIGDNQAIVFKIESHNHPSFIDPYQGAATGVGGILRDVFTMGARPIALMNVLRFGEIGNPLTNHLLSGVVKGIGGYGNCIGIPTIGGETNFNQSYNSNILVNAMAVGLVNKNKIFYSAASGIGNPVIYVGAKTGRDGIHGATMASAEFSDDTESQKPTVQVGDPFTGKLLLEACLELMKTDLILSIQDMGAAGLTSSSVEMASKGNVGIEIDLDEIPLREKNMSSYEIMLSESQERMLMILKKGAEDDAKKIFKKWDLDFAVIGKIISEKKIILKKENKIVCNLPLDFLVNESPELSREYVIKTSEKILDNKNIIKKESIKSIIYKIIENENFASKKWIYEQYDSSVMGDTISIGNKSDASIVKIHNSEKGEFKGKAVAISTDCNSKYILNNPIEGGKITVAEAARNLVVSGAKPLAVTNNLNFGNPEKKEVMGQIVGSIKGIKEACEQLNTPVVSGNVSLYNETNGKSILPTPVIGMVGIVDDIEKIIYMNAKNNETLFIVGQDENKFDGFLQSSLYQEIFCDDFLGQVPPINLKKEKHLYDFIMKLNDNKIINSAHDISDGGLLPCMIEMLLFNKLGIDINLPPRIQTPNEENLLFLHGWLFGEDQSRIIISTNKPDRLMEFSKSENIKIYCIGKTNNTGVVEIPKYDSICINKCLDLYNNTIPNLFS